MKTVFILIFIPIFVELIKIETEIGIKDQDKDGRRLSLKCVKKCFP